MFPEPLVSTTPIPQVIAMTASKRIRVRRASRFLSIYDVEMAKTAEKLRVQDNTGTALIKSVVLKDEITHERPGATAPF